MAVSNGYVSIGNSGQNSWYVHEFSANKDGSPGKLTKMIDGAGDINQVAKSYIDKGFDPSKIKINGQIASDVFNKDSGINTENSTQDNKKNFVQRCFDNIKNFFKGIRQHLANLPVLNDMSSPILDQPFINMGITDSMNPFDPGSTLYNPTIDPGNCACPFNPCNM